MPALPIAEFSVPPVLYFVVPASIWAELIGVPVAWMRLRKTAEWSEKPTDVRSIDLLARFVGKLTGLVVLWVAITALGAFLAGGF